jgi:leader peptidase (prepilin peptidase) / N-methyltransferase
MGKQPTAGQQPRVAPNVFPHPRAVTRLDPSHLATGMAMLAAAVASVMAVSGIRGILGGGLAVVMIAIAAVDARRYIIPDGLTLAAFALGVACAAVETPDAMATHIVEALLRGGAFGLTFLAVRAGYRYFRRRDGLGLGDVKLAGAGGLWIGWLTMPLVVEIAVAAALSFYLVRWLAGGRRGGAMRLDDRLPFGLFLAPSIWLGWLVDNAGPRGLFG